MFILGVILLQDQGCLRYLDLVVLVGEKSLLCSLTSLIRFLRRIKKLHFIHDQVRILDLKGIIFLLAEEYSFLFVTRND